MLGAWKLAKVLEQSSPPSSDGSINSCKYPSGGLPGVVNLVRVKESDRYSLVVVSLSSPVVLLRFSASDLRFCVEVPLHERGGTLTAMDLYPDGEVLVGATVLNDVLVLPIWEIMQTYAKLHLSSKEVELLGNHFDEARGDRRHAMAVEAPGEWESDLLSKLKLLASSSRRNSSSSSLISVAALRSLNAGVAHCICWRSFLPMRDVAFLCSMSGMLICFDCRGREVIFVLALPSSVGSILSMELYDTESATCLILRSVQRPCFWRLQLKTSSFSSCPSSATHATTTSRPQFITILDESSCAGRPPFDFESIDNLGEEHMSSSPSQLILRVHSRPAGTVVGYFDASTCDLRLFHPLFPYRDLARIPLAAAEITPDNNSTTKLLMPVQVGELHNIRSNIHRTTVTDVMLLRGTMVLTISWVDSFLVERAGAGGGRSVVALWTARPTVASFIEEETDGKEFMQSSSISSKQKNRFEPPTVFANKKIHEIALPPGQRIIGCIPGSAEVTSDQYCYANGSVWAYLWTAESLFILEGSREDIIHRLQDALFIGVALESITQQDDSYHQVEKSHEEPERLPVNSASPGEVIEVDHSIFELKQNFLTACWALEVDFDTIIGDTGAKFFWAAEAPDWAPAIVRSKAASTWQDVQRIALDVWSLVNSVPLELLQPCLSLENLSHNPLVDPPRTLQLLSRYWNIQPTGGNSQGAPLQWLLSAIVGMHVMSLVASSSIKDSMPLERLGEGKVPLPSSMELMDWATATVTLMLLRTREDGRDAGATAVLVPSIIDDYSKLLHWAEDEFYIWRKTIETRRKFWRSYSSIATDQMQQPQPPEGEANTWMTTGVRNNVEKKEVYKKKEEKDYISPLLCDWADCLEVFADLQDSWGLKEDFSAKACLRTARDLVVHLETLADDDADISSSRQLILMTWFCFFGLFFDPKRCKLTDTLILSDHPLHFAILAVSFLLLARKEKPRVTRDGILIFLIWWKVGIDHTGNPLVPSQEERVDPFFKRVSAAAYLKLYKTPRQYNGDRALLLEKGLMNWNTVVVPLNEHLFESWLPSRVIECCSEKEDNNISPNFGILESNSAAMTGRPFSSSSTIILIATPLMLFLGLTSFAISQQHESQPNRLEEEEGVITRSVVMPTEEMILSLKGTAGWRPFSLLLLDETDHHDEANSSTGETTTTRGGYKNNFSSLETSRQEPSSSNLDFLAKLCEDHEWIYNDLPWTPSIRLHLYSAAASKITRC